MSISRSERLQAELAERMARLAQRGRPRCDAVDDGAKLFDRAPPDAFRDGRLVGGYQLRSPEHSVTLEQLDGAVIADALDALLVIGPEGFMRLSPECGVSYITAAQVRSCLDDNPGGRYTLDAAHDPYPCNYAHGNVVTLNDGVSKRWPPGVKKKFKADLQRFVMDGERQQVALLPGEPASDAG